MASELKLDGWDKFRGKANNLPKDLVIKVDAFVQRAAQDWSGLTKRSAPKNFGKLAGAIQPVDTGVMSAEVLAPVKYAPYLEWGTGTRVSVPADLTNYAIQFKGVKSVIGVYPHPYFFMHKKPVEQTLNARIDKYLTTPQ